MALGDFTPEERRARLSKQRGRLAAQIADPKDRSEYIARQGEEERKERNNVSGPPPGDGGVKDLQNETDNDEALGMDTYSERKRRARFTNASR